MYWLGKACARVHCPKTAHGMLLVAVIGIKGSGIRQTRQRCEGCQKDTEMISNWKKWGASNKRLWATKAGKMGL